MNNEAICSKCKNLFFKGNGVFSNEKWFCSNECEPKLQEIYEEWKRQNNKNTTKTMNLKGERRNMSKEKEIDLGLGDYEERPSKIKRIEDLV